MGMFLFCLNTLSHGQEVQSCLKTAWTEGVEIVYGMLTFICQCEFQLLEAFESSRNTSARPQVWKRRRDCPFQSPDLLLECPPGLHCPIIHMGKPQGHLACPLRWKNNKDKKKSQ